MSRLAQNKAIEMRNQFVNIAAAIRALCLATRKNGLWLFILAYAVTACVWKPSAVADAWWLIFVPVWIFAHRKHPEQRSGAGLLISSLLLFGWLFNSTQSAAVVAFRSWFIPAGELWLRNLSFPLQATLASLITALTLTVPIRRIAGRDSTGIAILVGLPYAYSEGRDNIFWVRTWAEHPLANCFHLFDVFAPSVILVVGCKLHERFVNSRRVSVPLGRLLQFCQRLLNGQPGVGTTFFGIFIPTLILLATGIHERNEHAKAWLISASGSAIYVLIFAVPFMAFALATISVWKSLSRFKSRNTLSANLAEFGQIIVLLATMPILLISVISEIPSTAVAFQNGIHLVPGKPWNVVADGNILRISGEFTLGVGQAAEHVINSDPNIRIVVLESLGGDIAEGMRIAAAITSHNLSTGVQDECSSACTDAFVAGRERIILPHTLLGFHTCHPMVWNSLCNNAEYESYLVKKGIDRQFAREVLAVPPEKIWYPTEKELIEAHVITRTIRRSGEKQVGNLTVETAPALQSDKYARDSLQSDSSRQVTTNPK
jgi:hypothetical protein